MRRTRVNTALMYHLEFLGVTQSSFGHRIRDQGIGGSNPLCPTNFLQALAATSELEVRDIPVEVRGTVEVSGGNRCRSWRSPFLIPRTLSYQQPPVWMVLVGMFRTPTYGRLRDGIARSAIGLCSRIPASGPEKDQDNSSLASRLGYHLTSVSLPFSPLREACLLSQSPSDEVTQLLHRWTNGDEKALQDLAPIVYEELRRLAHYYLRSERPEHTLESTALVHEAYLRLIGGQPVELQNRDHFFAVASRLMRQILVDYARSRAAAKRDGGCRISLSHALDIPIAKDKDLVALDRALEELARIDERQARIVELKFFGGLSSTSAASVLNISRATVDREWAVARLWLHRHVRTWAQP
jgi:RNA polymerase sigma factor (TIGR02999 family)